MSHEVFTKVIQGATTYVGQAVRDLAAAREQRGDDAEVGFPETAFSLPMAYSLMGLEARTVADLIPIVAHCKELLPNPPAEQLWYPYLGSGLDAGAATMLAMEVSTALKYSTEPNPVPEGWQGFISDTIMRELGIQLVDGRMPGFAAILGPAPTVEIACHTVLELQKRSILAFTFANRDGLTMREQLIEGGILKEGMDLRECWDTYIVPVGPETLDGIYVLNWAIRSALTFGGHQRGEARKCIDYTKTRIFASGITFGEIPPDWYAIGAGAILMGFPIISDTPTTPEIRPTGVTTYEALVVEEDPMKLVPTMIETRGVKVTVVDIDIPVPFAAAFEGERVRREDMHVQFGGKYSGGVEYLSSAELDEIEDGKIELIGPDIDSVEPGGVMSLGLRVRVAGRKMQKDFESILERQIHSYLSHASGVMHTGQRDQIWVRVSNDAFAQGFRLKHLGTILHAKLHDDYAGIVDRAEFVIRSEPEAVAALVEEARPMFVERDARVAGMRDEDVDTFYSCTLCQSYAPNHVCVITPERLGLCGAYNWLDGKAAHEINPTGCNQPVVKGRAIDETMGEWEGVNQFVADKSNRAIQHFSAYSLMTNPMTSCGCFECILAIVPEANGVMIVNREYPGDTPIGMPFSTLAGSVGGGAQTPGFLGVGRLYLTSRKFISNEGGLPRIVWLPKDLKEDLRERLEARADEMGLDGFVDKIADETVTSDVEGLLAHMEQVGHPALTMDPLF
jgi:acetyl-CoA synthase